jgi:hypothetical protein
LSIFQQRNSKKKSGRISRNENGIGILLPMGVPKIGTKNWNSQTRSKAGKVKKLANRMKQALNGKAKKKWTEITNQRMAWNKANMQEKFYKMLQKLKKENFGTWAYKKQVVAMENGLLKLPEEQDLRDSINRLFAIDREIPYLGIGGEEL